MRSQLHDIARIHAFRAWLLLQLSRHGIHDKRVGGGRFFNHPDVEYHQFTNFYGPTGCLAGLLWRDTWTYRHLRSFPAGSGLSSASCGLIGLFIALAGAYIVSVGNVVGSRNAKKGVPVTQANAFGMAYGGLLTLFIHFAIGGTLTIDWSIGYLGPMLYLTIFGSITAFGCYMLLISRIGAEYAAYVTLLMPIIALVLSNHV